MVIDDAGNRLAVYNCSVLGFNRLKADRVDKTIRLNSRTSDVRRVERRKYGLFEQFICRMLFICRTSDVRKIEKDFEVVET